IAKRWISQKHGGRILKMVTTYAAANCGSGFVVPSACAQAGGVGLSPPLSLGMGKDPIPINTGAPGAFSPERAWSCLMRTKQIEENSKQQHPMKRFGRHEELANLAAFLLSDMAEYINGECVVIDGGQWLRGAGEFNDLMLLPEGAWETMEAARQKKS